MAEYARQLELPLGEALVTPPRPGTVADRYGSTPDTFFRPRPDVADPRLLTYLDAMFAVELALKDHLPSEVLVQQRSRLISFYRDTTDIPMVKVYGSARDVVWSPKLEEFCDELALLSVASGLSLGNGGGATGAMGKTIRAWEEHTRTHRGRGEETASQIVLVPLEFFEETFEAPITGVDAVMAPGTTALQLRTTLLHAVGDTVASVYFPGGLGTLEELVGDLVARQLRGLIDTPHGHRIGLGQIWLINPELVPDGGSFWRATIEQLDMFARSGAMSEADRSAIRTLTLEDPRADAALLVREALRCRDSDACRFPSR